MENSMSQMDMPEENISQMSGDGDVSPIKGMSSDDNMNSVQEMPENTKLVIMPLMTGNMSMDT